jgi:putative PIN family toxin of toxin-antitoxin system
MIRSVIDTNVLYSGLRSRNGASFRLLESLGGKSFQPCISVPLVLEYQQTLTQKQSDLTLSVSDIESVLDYLCSIGHKQRIFYLWRPLLRDTKDDMVLELAVAAECEYIVTYNRKDFSGAERFGISIVSPLEFLKAIGELP